MKMTKSGLASELNQVANSAAAVDKASEQVFGKLQRLECETLGRFNDLISEAYSFNGWSQNVGRQAKESKLRPAPGTVKVYVSTIRRGYRMELPVLTYRNLHELQKAIRENMPKPANVPIQAKFNVVRHALSDKDREAFDAKVLKLLAQYQTRLQLVG